MCVCVRVVCACVMAAKVLLAARVPNSVCSGLSAEDPLSFPKGTFGPEKA